MNHQPPNMRLDAMRAIRNLSVLAALGGVIAFACVLITDQISRIAGGIPLSLSDTLVLSGLVALSGLVCGFVYIPVVGSVNEKLFGVAITAMLAAVVAQKLSQDGLDWSLLPVGAALLCFGVLAAITPSRIKAAYTTNQVDGGTTPPLIQAVRSTPRQQRRATQQQPQQAPYQQPTETSEFPVPQRQHDDRYGL